MYPLEYSLPDKVRYGVHLGLRWNYTPFSLQTQGLAVVNINNGLRKTALLDNAAHAHCQLVEVINTAGTIIGVMINKAESSRQSDDRGLFRESRLSVMWYKLANIRLALELSLVVKPSLRLGG